MKLIVNFGKLCKKKKLFNSVFRIHNARQRSQTFYSMLKMLQMLCPQQNAIKHINLLQKKGNCPVMSVVKCYLINY